MDPSTTDELAACLRSWRERVGPAEVGLPAGGQRRVRGLRREEVAQLAGVSMDYLNRLEQGRATSPSPSVLASLARALRLSEVERDHLYLLAGQPLPGSGFIDPHIPPSMLRLMDRLSDVAVVVNTMAGELIAANPLATALFCETALSGSRRERTLAWREFMGLETFRRFQSEAERTDNEEVLVADLQRALASYPNDTYLNELVGELRQQCARFDELWNQHRLHGRHAHEKTFFHPEVGEIQLNCDDFTVEGTALRMAVFSAVPGSDSARALELLSAIGLQRFEAGVA